MRHNPEFTMMECYQAYGDYHTMMDLVEGMVVQHGAGGAAARCRSAIAGARST